MQTNLDTNTNDPGRASWPMTAVEKLTHDYGCQADHAVQLVKIADILGKMWANIQPKQAEVNRLEALDRCHGRIYWRNEEIMYLNHSGGQDCPYCGSCAGKERIRRYIGTNEEKQAAARTARHNWTDWVTAKQSAHDARADYNAMTARLNSVVMKQGSLW